LSGGSVAAQIMPAKATPCSDAAQLSRQQQQHLRLRRRHRKKVTGETTPPRLSLPLEARHRICHGKIIRAQSPKRVQN